MSTQKLSDVVLDFKPRMHDRPVVSNSLPPSAFRNSARAPSDCSGSTKITAAAANIQSSKSLSGAGQSVGLSIAARLL
jgi:hypothetical protein